MANVVNLYGTAAAIPLDELASMSKAQLVQCATILHSALTVANKNRFSLQRELDIIQADLRGQPVSPERKFICDLEGKCLALEDQLKGTQQAMMRIAGENGHLKRFIHEGVLSPQLIEMNKENKSVPPVPAPVSLHQQQRATTPPSRNSSPPSSSPQSFFAADRGGSSSRVQPPPTVNPTSLSSPLENPFSPSSFAAAAGSTSTSVLPLSKSAESTKVTFQDDQHHQQQQQQHSGSGTSSVAQLSPRRNDNNNNDDDDNGDEAVDQSFSPDDPRQHKEQQKQKQVAQILEKSFIRKSEDRVKQQYEAKMSVMERNFFLKSKQLEGKVAMLQDELSRTKGEMAEHARALRLRETPDVQYFRSMKEKLEKQTESDREEIFKLKTQIATMTCSLRELQSETEERVREQILTRIMEEEEDETEDFLMELLPKETFIKWKNGERTVRQRKKNGEDHQAQQHDNGNNKDHNSNNGGGGVRSYVEVETQTDSNTLRIVDVLKQREDELRSSKLEIHALTEKVLALNRDLRDEKRETEELKREVKKYAGLVADLQAQLKIERNNMIKQRNTVLSNSNNNGSMIFSASGNHNTNNGSGNGMMTSSSSLLSQQQAPRQSMLLNQFGRESSLNHAGSMILSNNNNTLVSNNSMTGSFLQPQQQQPLAQKSFYHQDASSAGGGHFPITSTTSSLGLGDTQRSVDNNNNNNNNNNVVGAARKHSIMSNIPQTSSAGNTPLVSSSQMTQPTSPLAGAINSTLPPALISRGGAGGGTTTTSVSAAASGVGFGSTSASLNTSQQSAGSGVGQQQQQQQQQQALQQQRIATSSLALANQASFGTFHKSGTFSASPSVTFA